MNETALIVITALCSGLVATCVTIWWQNHSQIKKEKQRIFSILMSKRYELSAEDSVGALNMIDVVFYKSPKVREAWRNFIEATNAPDTPTREQMIADKHLRLLEVIAEDGGYKNIRWDDIKQYYYPIGLSDRKKDESILRKVQIDAAISQINGNQNHEKAVQTDKQTEFNNMVLQKAIENPEGFAKLLEVASKTHS